MAMKLYVGGLPYSTTEQDLNDLFAAEGTVTSASVIKDKFSGQSKGFGFVEMSDDAEAKNAIQALNGKDFGGRSLTVNEARPQEERRSGGNGGGYGGNRGGGRSGGGGRGGFGGGNSRRQY